MSASQIFLVFDHLDRFKVYWFGILYNGPPLGIICISHDEIGVMGLGEEANRGNGSHQGHLPSAWLITADDGLDHLAQVGSARFLHCS